MFEKIVTFSAAFDRRHTDPNKNYGIHGVELRMVLRGPLGATQFLLYTNWMLPHVTLQLPNALQRPLPSDRGYHWSTPQYEGQKCRDCDLLPSGKCYYDGSSLSADDTFRLLLEKGDAGVWGDLEEFYNELATAKEAA
jgi:hypothetical protein